MDQVTRLHTRSENVPVEVTEHPFNDPKQQNQTNEPEKQLLQKDESQQEEQLTANQGDQVPAACATNIKRDPKPFHLSLSWKEGENAHVRCTVTSVQLLTALQFMLNQVITWSMLLKSAPPPGVNFKTAPVLNVHQSL